MEIAYFFTASILCLWVYRQTRRSAKNIRRSRRSHANTFE